MPVVRAKFCAAGSWIRLARLSECGSTTRASVGMISCRSCSHLAPIVSSKSASPGSFPPGRAKLLTKPTLTGSAPVTNTTGIERVC